MGKVRVRFPNESYGIEVNTFHINDFSVTNVFDTEVFGVWGDLHVSIPRETFDELIKKQYPLKTLQTVAVKHDISVHCLQEIIRDLKCN